MEVPRSSVVDLEEDDDDNEDTSTDDEDRRLEQKRYLNTLKRMQTQINQATMIVLLVPSPTHTYLPHAHPRHHPSNQLSFASLDFEEASCSSWCASCCSSCASCCGDDDNGRSRRDDPYGDEDNRRSKNPRGPPSTIRGETPCYYYLLL